MRESGHSISRVIAIGVLAFFAAGCGLRDDLGSKREWSILQVAEFANRDRGSQEKMIFYNREEYRAVGITSDDLPNRVWILLNPRYDPQIKEMPLLSYHLSNGELERILSEGNPSRAVVEHLRTKVR